MNVVFLFSLNAKVCTFKLRLNAKGIAIFPTRFRSTGQVKREYVELIWVIEPSEQTGLRLDVGRTSQFIQACSSSSVFVSKPQRHRGKDRNQPQNIISASIMLPGLLSGMVCHLYVKPL
jgi:hypothetical protein